MDHLPEFQRLQQTCSLDDLIVYDDIADDCVKVQEDTACTRLDCCRHLHKLCLHNPDYVFWASRPSLPAAWLALLLTKAGDVESNPGPTTHTNKHTPVIWICDLCHKQINKKQTSIRQHTLGSSELYTYKQRQYSVQT